MTICARAVRWLTSRSPREHLRELPAQIHSLPSARCPLKAEWEVRGNHTQPGQSLRTTSDWENFTAKQKADLMGSSGQRTPLAAPQSSRPTHLPLHPHPINLDSAPGTLWLGAPECVLEGSLWPPSVAALGHLSAPCVTAKVAPPPKMCSVHGLQPAFTYRPKCVIPCGPSHPTGSCHRSVSG